MDLGHSVPLWLQQAMVITDSRDIELSTIRILEFSANSFQNPKNGYRHLGVLSSISISPRPAPKLFPVLFNNSEGQQFVEVWSDLNLNFAQHFILILTEIKRPPPSFFPPPSIPSSTMSTWSMIPDPTAIRSFALEDDGRLSPMLNHLQLQLSQTTPAVDSIIPPNDHSLASDNILWESVAPQALDIAHREPLISAAATVYSRASLPTILADEAIPASPQCPSALLPGGWEDGLSLPIFHDGMELSDVYDVIGISVHQLDAARFQASLSRTASLYSMMQNFRSLAQLLHLLNLPTFENDRTVSGSYTFPYGPTISSAAVIKDLGWSTATYCNKARAHMWAQEISQMSWAGLHPTGKCFSMYFTLSDIDITFVGHNNSLPEDYKTWQGIVAMFGDGGLLDSNTIPQTKSRDSAIVNAARLSQNTLLKRKLDMSLLLSNPRT